MTLPKISYKLCPTTISCYTQLIKRGVSSASIESYTNSTV